MHKLLNIVILSDIRNTILYRGEQEHILLYKLSNVVITYILVYGTQNPVSSYTYVAVNRDTEKEQPKLATF